LVLANDPRRVEEARPFSEIGNWAYAKRKMHDQKILGPLIATPY
jgi:hypothetical protein